MKLRWLKELADCPFRDEDSRFDDIRVHWWVGVSEIHVVHVTETRFPCSRWRIAQNVRFWDPPLRQSLFATVYQLQQPNSPSTFTHKILAESDIHYSRLPASSS